MAGNGRSQTMAALAEDIDHLKGCSASPSSAEQLFNLPEAQPELHELCQSLEESFLTEGQRKTKSMSKTQTTRLNHLLRKYHNLDPSVNWKHDTFPDSPILPPLDVSDLDSISALHTLTMDRRNRRRLAGESQLQFDFASRALALVVLDRTKAMMSTTFSQEGQGEMGG